MVDGRKLALAALFLVPVLVMGYRIGTEVTTHLDRTDDVATTEGRIQSVDYHEREVSDDVEKWVLDVRYVYTVDGETYVGETLRADGTNDLRSERAARRLVERYSRNATVEVHYVRSDPGQSFLRAGSPLGILLDNAVYLFGMVVATVLGVYNLLPGLGVYYPPPFDRDRPG